MPATAEAQQLFTRAATVSPVKTVNRRERSIEAVLATESKARVYDPGRRTTIEEVLLADGCDTSGFAVLLDNHERTLGGALGSVREIRQERAKIVGRLFFSDADPRAESAWRKTRDGHIRDVSAGYRVLEYQDVEPGKTATIGGKRYTAGRLPLRVTTRWRLREVSLTPIGADSRATTRTPTPPTLVSRKETPMPQGTTSYSYLETTRTRDDVVTAAMRRAGVDPAREGVAPKKPSRGTSDDHTAIAICRDARVAAGEQLRRDMDMGEFMRTTVMSNTVEDVFTDSVNALLVRSFHGANDTTKGWTSETETPGFDDQARPRIENSERLERLARAGTAEQAILSAEAETYKKFRYAKAWKFWEEDIIDDQVAAITRMPKLIGLTAARVRPDLVHSIILSNPEMADGKTLFHADRSNLVTSPLSTASLKVAIAAMRAQREHPDVALNIEPRFLVVPPSLETEAIELVKALTIEAAFESRGLRLEVRADDRLGPAGVVDPSSGEKYTGSHTNWLLAAHEEEAPTIEVGFLAGTSRQPVVRGYILDKGEWGFGWDVNYDLGAKALSGLGLHFSTGTGE